MSNPTQWVILFLCVAQVALVILNLRTLRNLKRLRDATNEYCNTMIAFQEAQERAAFEQRNAKVTS